MHQKIKINTAYSLLILLLLSVSINSQAAIPLLEPENIETSTTIKHWNWIEIQKKPSDVEHILLTQDNQLWIGTSNGVVVYDKGKIWYPEQTIEGERSFLITQDIADLRNGRVLFGTINGTLWLADRHSITKLVDFNDRARFNFLRNGDIIELATNFGVRSESEHEELLKIINELNLPIRVRTQAIDRFGKLGDRLFGISSGKLFELFDNDYQYITDFGDTNTIYDVVPHKNNGFLVSAYSGCYEVILHEPAIVNLLYKGYCPAITVTHSNEIWLSTGTGVYRFDSVHWTRVFDEDAVEINPVKALLDDGKGNFWLGGNSGVWRRYNHAKKINIPEAQSSPVDVEFDQDGNLFVGFVDGTAWRIDKNGDTAQLDIGPINTQPPVYYRGTLIHRDVNQQIWLFNHNGLYKINGLLSEKISDYPQARDYRQSPIVTFAVNESQDVYAGAAWSTDVYKLENTAWKTVKSPVSYFGGNAVNDMMFDPQGRLWVASNTQVLMLENGRWTEFGPYPRAPDVKANLFGFITHDPVHDEILATGAWGYPVIISKQESGFKDVPLINQPQDQPAYFYHSTLHDKYGFLALTDIGLVFFDPSTERWEKFNIIFEQRLEALGAKLFASPNTDSIALLADGLYKITIPTASPEIILARKPDGIIEQNSTTLQFRTTGFSGPPDERKVIFAIEPPMLGIELGIPTSRTRFDLSQLKDGQHYSYSARAVDGFGNTSDWLKGEFTVELPFYKNPMKLVAVIIGVLLLLALIVTRRGPAGYILRVILGKRWQLNNQDPDLEIEITQPGLKTLNFRLRTPAKQTTVEANALNDISPSQLSRVRNHESRIVNALVGNVSHPSSNALLASSINTLGNTTHALLPEQVQLLCQQASGGHIKFIIEDQLMDIPWELAHVKSELELALSSAVARTILTTEAAYKTTDAVKDFEVCLFAPEHDNSLKSAQPEIHAISKQIRTWDANITILPPDSDKQTVLSALTSANLFHYAGHAVFDTELPAMSFLPIHGDIISADEINTALSEQTTQLYLAFINGCSSSRESNWHPGQSTFGLASGFLKNASYFIGAQWPVADIHAMQFAQCVYQSLFPDISKHMWKWWLGKGFEGEYFAEAVRQARLVIQDDTHNAASTWPAYVYYGNPRSRIELA